MKKKLVLILLFTIFLVVPLTQASLFNSKKITFSLDQKEYYFKTGENAVLNLNSESNYGETINGQLDYTVLQSVNQGGVSYSSSNTQSTPFSIEDGKKTIPLNFGTSKDPVDLSINLKFTYTHDNQMEVPLNNILIHFVSDDSQKKNQQQKTSSSSKKSQNSQQSNNQQSQKQQTASQKQQSSIANNQMNQDSSALKQEIQKQNEEEQKRKEAFQKELAKNPDFQKENQDLAKQGYKPTTTDVNPTSNNTGDFQVNYQNDKGETASLKGDMKNGKINNLEKETAQTRQEMLDSLNQSKDFQKYQKQLKKEGFIKNNTEFSKQGNKTEIKMDYTNKNNETAQITAEILNKTVKKVDLIKNSKTKKNNYFWILGLFLLGVILFYVYKKFYKKSPPKKEELKLQPQKEFDYKSEANSLLKKSQILFDKKEYKDAYGTASQALRLFLSYENKLKKETTNDEIIESLRKHNKSFKEAKECFDLCSLVEFAKYTANKKDFDKIVSSVEKLIK